MNLVQANGGINARSRANVRRRRCACALLRIAAVVPMLAALAGCSGGGASQHGPTTPTVLVSPASTSLTTAQPLTVSVTVKGGGFAGAPPGTVTLTSGAFSSGAEPLNNGAATLVIPAGVLAAQSDTLSVQYTPSANAAASFNTAAGAANVTVLAAAAPTVTAQTTASVATDGHPFEALPVGGNVLVSVSSNGDTGSVTGVRVYTAAAPTQLAYSCTQIASHPNHLGVPDAFGLATLPNGLDLALAVDDAGVDLLDQAATIGSCSSSETLVSQGAISTAQGTFTVTVTPDGKYAFVANEYGVVAQDSTGANIEGNVGVVALTYDASGRLASGTLLGQFSTGGQAIANVTLSPDGTRLYVTSEIDHPGVAVSGTANTVLAHAGCVQSTDDVTASGSSTYGLLSVVDVAKAEAAPDASSIIATVASGCSPVRVVETADGQVIWVAARGDNRVLAFSTHMLETDPDNALLGYGDTGGIAPVGLQLFHNQQLLAVANSDRFANPAVYGNMTIMSATPVNPSVVQKVAAQYFPRSVTLAGDDSTLYLTDFDSALVQIVTTSVN